jgi:hypothetical protein
MLLNGAEGIGTGFSSVIPSFNHEDIIKSMISFVETGKIKKIKPYFRYYTDKVDSDEKGRIITKMSFKQVGEKIFITEVPRGYDASKIYRHLNKHMDADFLKDYIDSSVDNVINIELIFKRGQTPALEEVEKTYAKISELPIFKFIDISYFRSATDLSHYHEEGMIDESKYKNGIIKLLNSRGKRPRKIMLDLSTNYVNLDYPADTYPLYRHYEWLDVDKDGIGNSFMLTYSDKTTHEAWIQTNKIGDIKLYDKPFQEIYVKQLDGTIEIALTKAEKVRHLNIDYALKGPWKIIYYLEW